MTKGLVQKHVSCANLTEGRWLLQEVVETRALIYQESVEEIINPIVHMEFLMFVCMKMSKLMKHYYDCHSRNIP